MIRGIQIFIILLFAAIAVKAQTKVVNYDEYTAPNGEIRNMKSNFMVIKTSPITMVVGPIPIAGEYRVGVEISSRKSQSVNIAASYLGKSIFLAAALVADSGSQGNSYKDLTMHGWRGQIGYRFYLGKPGSAPDFFLSPSQSFGWYVEPHLDYQYLKINNKVGYSQGKYLSITHFNVTALVGFQMKWGKRIMFELYSGMGYKNNFWYDKTTSGPGEVVDDNGQSDYYNSAFKFSLGTTIGYLW